ncbi:uncharacterized membrane protein YccC [Rhodobacter sp. JA431]|uniref:FUSC family protein n=1 Tax=Rhodobacter sp. JA431 TaxID=570013 RepID=UPI000BD7EF83|nr:FUSC family protein [Rhodobacter sp. JA431]SOC15858.1 uncharacterized membrane protein YccC [Rhodobacter sp. JA431]
MTRTQLGQALRLGLAAWTAFAVATALGIEHAFWASMPVWVVAQPWRGVVFERALWRLLGTLIGGGIGLVLLTLSPTPWVTAVVMAALLALGGALTHLWQGVRNYLPMMTALTIGVVVIPALLDPSGGFDLAMDRLACTFIGGVSVALIVGLFTPKADSAGFRAEGAALAQRFPEVARLLLDTRVPTTRKDEVVAEVIHLGAELETKARLVAAGSREGYRRMAALDAILAAGLALLEAATEAARNFPTREAAQRLLSDEPGTGPLPETGPLPRLSRSLAALGAAIDELQSTAPSGRDLPRLAPPANPTLALRGAVVAALASFAGSAMQILVGGFAMELTAFSMAIFALVMGSLPQPKLIAPKMAVGVVIGAVTGAAYRIGLQPHLTGWLDLVITILPFIAVGAIARAYPRTAIYALDYNMCFMLASQAGAAPALTPDVIQSAIAMTVGTLAIVVCYVALPRPGPALIGRTEARLAADLELIAKRSEPISAQRWTAIWGRRVVTLAIELEKAGEALPRRVLRLASAGHAAIDNRKISAPRSR